MRLTLPLLFAALALPAAAHAGGWATVEVDQPVGLSAGEPWQAELLVKQHGITPLDGLTPSVRIDNGAGVVERFVARPAGRPGTYVATVTYPEAGTWRTRIFDGFTDAVPHRLPPMVVAPAGKGDETAVADREGGEAAVAGGGTILPDRERGATVTAPERGAAADDAFPWPQVVAIALVALAFAGAWTAGAGTFRSRDRGRRRTASATVAGRPQARS